MSTPITYIVAEDEPLQRQALLTALAQLWPHAQCLAECETGLEALEAIEQHNPQVAFLDIRMPGISGLEVAKATAGKVHVVFTTAYDHYAVEAFEQRAVDYVLKPVQPARIAQSLQRIEEAIGNNKEPKLQELPDELNKPAQTAEPLRWISATAGSTVKLFKVEDVLFFQSADKYTRVVTVQDEAVIRTPLKDLLTALDHNQFWQIHRSTIVQVAAIAAAHRDELSRLTVALKGHNEKLQVSQAFAYRFKGM